MNKKQALVHRQVRKYTANCKAEAMPKENRYPEYVRQKNIIDLVHQITIVLYRNDEMARELNRYFRSSLEPMLLHIDQQGRYDCDFNDDMGKEGKD